VVHVALLEEAQQPLRGIPFTIQHTFRHASIADLQRLVAALDQRVRAAVT